MEVVIMKSAIGVDPRKLYVVIGLSGFFVILLFFSSSNYPFGVDNVIDQKLSTSGRGATYFSSSSSSSSSPPPGPSWVNIQAGDIVDSSSNSRTTSTNTTAITNHIGQYVSIRSDGGNATDRNDYRHKRNNMVEPINITFTSTPPNTNASKLTISQPPSEKNDAKEEEEKKKYNNCNIFEGRWVYKPSTPLLYKADQCPFLEVVSTCQKNGRPEADYQGWSWEPFDCHLPLLNGKDMLERLRGKRVMIAGDSLNRNQWESLACLLYTSIPDPSRVLITRSGTDKALKALDYNFSLEFYWCPFLVDVEKDKINGRRVMHLDRLVPSSEKWRGADVMVFNTGHWWNHGIQIRGWDVFKYKGDVIDDMERDIAYERGLKTWLKWVYNNVDPNKTAVFFRSVSPEHKGKHWCFNATTPINNLDELCSYVSTFPSSMLDVVERLIVNDVGAAGSDVTKNRFPRVIRYLNITGLSVYRRDAHPSLYRQPRPQFKTWNNNNNNNNILNVAKQQADCSHWCLPGVPDTWNRLLSFLLLQFQFHN